MTVHDAGNGVQVKASAVPTGQQTAIALSVSQKDLNTVNVYNATVTVPASGPALVVTNGAVNVVNDNAAPLATAASTETGVQFKIGADGTATGTVGGTAVSINPANGDVSVDASHAQVIPAAAAAPDAAATHVSIRKDFKGASVKGPTADVRIELAADGVPAVYTSGKVSVKYASEANAETESGSASVKANGNQTRVILGEQVFDVDSKGNAISYNGDAGVQNPGAPKPDDTALASTDDYQLVIGKDLKSVSLNGAGVAQSADGALVVATDGTSGLKSAVVAEAVSIPAHEQAIQGIVEQAQAAHTPGRPAPSLSYEAGDKTPDGWVCLGVVSTKDPFVRKTLFVAPEDLAGTQTYAEAVEAAKALKAQGIDARLPTKSEIKAMKRTTLWLGSTRQLRATQATTGHPLLTLWPRAKR